MSHLDAFLNAMRADAALIHRPENMRWLAGYTGEGCLFIAKGIHAVLTDFRYYEQTRRQAPDWTLVEISGGRDYPARIATIAAEQGCRRIWYAIKPAYLTPSFFNAQLHAYLHLEKRIVFLKSAVCIGAGLLFFAACAFFEARGDSLRGFISRQVLPVRWILLYGLLFMVILFGVYGPGYDAAAFIYGGF